MSPSKILNNKRQRKLSQRRFKINQRVELMRHLETEVCDLLSFIFIVLYGLHIYATRTLKGNISKTNKRDVTFVPFIVIVLLKKVLKKEFAVCFVFCSRPRAEYSSRTFLSSESSLSCL